MRILFALPGFHRFDRGAEVALLAIASELAAAGDDVTVIGSGSPRAQTAYAFRQVRSVRRENFERWPKLPLMRSDTVYEDATFAVGLAAAYCRSDYDITVTCSYPFTNWVLRRPGFGRERPAHIFVTQNGDWPAQARNSEYRLFGCDGLVCINPDFFETNRKRWRCALIPNGVDLNRFGPGAHGRKSFGFADGAPIVLMVSALIPTKRVIDGIRSVAHLPDACLVVAGDGPERNEVDRLASEILPGRFLRITLPASEMPGLYRSADVFLHLSKEESFGNVFVEAIATGLPVVGHDSQRLRWIVGDDEFLVDTGSHETTAAALGRAIASPASARAERIALAAKFGWREISRKYRLFFDEVLVAKRSV